MSYYTAEQKRYMHRLDVAIDRKVVELKGLAAKLKGRSPRDVARIRKYVETDIAYMQHQHAQWSDKPARPVCAYGSSKQPASSPSVGRPFRRV